MFMGNVRGEQSSERSGAHVGAEWLTFKKAGKILGRSPSAMRMWVKRRTAKGESVQVKKLPGKFGQVWYIHSSEVGQCAAHDETAVRGEQASSAHGEHVNMVTLEYYDEKRETWERERDELRSGLMMYQYKFEQAEKQLKLLPAPVEAVNNELEKLRQERDELHTKLETERARPWWKKALASMKIWKT